MTYDLRQHGVLAVLLDIEGTTTPITFVYDVLFPYARARMREYVMLHVDTPDVREAGRLLRDEWLQDVKSHEGLPAWSGDAPFARAEFISGYALWLMDRDRKSPGLKLLQGRIWEGGYRVGDLRGEVFDDVPPALQRWSEAGLTVAIYSSGSVLAQRLIFGHSAHGDLTRFITWFFDTGVGAKFSTDSYASISQALHLPPAGVLFVSDVERELDAASSAGLHGLLAVRPGNQPLSDTAMYPRIRSFEEIA